MAASVPGVLAQDKPQAPAGAKPAPAAAKPAPQAAQPATKPAAQPAAKPGAPAPAKPTGQAAQLAKQAAQPAAKPGLPAPGKPAAQAKPTAAKAAKAGAKPAKKAPAKAAARKVEKPASGGATAAAESEVKQARRDPFESLVNRQKNASDLAKLLPPGKAGLQVSTLRLDGIVKAPNGMIAVVSNPQARTYFLREGDHLYDGSVEKISMDGVSFHEEGKDAFGKPVERQVNKRIYSSPGEQQ
jgi:Tfp pilus assembly protein PilP